MGIAAIWSNQESNRLFDALKNHDQLIIKTANKIVSNSRQAEELLFLYLILSDPQDRNQFIISTSRIKDQIGFLEEISPSEEIKKIVTNLNSELHKIAAQADYLLLQHNKNKRFGSFLKNDQYRKNTKGFNDAVSRMTDTVFDLKNALYRHSSLQKDRIIHLTAFVKYTLFIIIALLVVSLYLGRKIASVSPSPLFPRKKAVTGNIDKVPYSGNDHNNGSREESDPSLKRIISKLRSSNEKLINHNKILKQEILKSRQKEKELHKQATTDFLTNVLNRRAFFEKAQEEVERTLRYKNKLSVLILDIDHFKSINDSYGHHAGDEVLKKFIHSVENILRNSDFIGRIGGEEFAVLLPETELDRALIIGERIRDRIGNITIPIEKLTLRLTVSLGAAEYNSGEKNIYSAIKRADAALYRAKESGRNRICTEALT